ncbi:glycosyltransferase family 4 protein [Saccharothrix variisporea]|uniref:Glycosyltransferase involved in cell wall biosynthesis n=1 Tax=Saccharothrix variisporea TaxID=543527 RepID=A0A495XF72_9PSEU|nr:glycosyltransferase family 4 protein [Saccharothrix variisporea]RKT72672.1 glycosyltransferase involved in cell wall biosynthesis [Saccharothrix variisporea]
MRGARVVVVNWRDLGHSAAGGAEVYAVRIAEAFVRAGASVTFLTARDRGQSASERGVFRTVRRGGRWTVYPWALLWLLVHRRRIDLVVDCQNGIPFFSPLAVGRRTRVVQVLHHVHHGQFTVHFPPWLAAIGQWLEGPAARRVYRSAATVAVSPSTVDAMRSRLRWRGAVHVVPNGSSPVPHDLPGRAAEPTVVCLGRLVPQKRVDRLIDAVDALRSRVPGLRLHVVGGGPEESALRERARRCDGAVVVHGHVPEAEKSALLAKSWVNVTLSDGEGWGLAVVEAAGHGVPTLCHDVDGLRDSVRHGETGWLVPAGEDVAEALHRVLKDLVDPTHAADIAHRCRAWASRFSWDDSGERFTALAADLLSRGDTGGWLPGMPEATVATFAPGTTPVLRWPGARVGDGWALVEQCRPADLLVALRAAGARDVTVRAASAAERLHGVVVDPVAGTRPRPPRRP